MCDGILITLHKTVLDKLKKWNRIYGDILMDGRFCAELLEDIFGKKILINYAIDMQNDSDGLNKIKLCFIRG